MVHWGGGVVMWFPADYSSQERDCVWQMVPLCSSIGQKLRAPPKMLPCWFFSRASPETGSPSYATQVFSPTKHFLKLVHAIVLWRCCCCCYACPLMRSRSSYITYLIREGMAKGWRCVVMNFPGTQGEKLTVCKFPSFVMWEQREGAGE